jgi:peptidoglycan/xylan/chitin deacetylase (PgdA/CDA1 family)
MKKNVRNVKKIVRNVKKMIKIFIIPLMFLSVFATVAGAYIPVTYTCCYNYTSSDGIQLDNFENTNQSGSQIDNFENLSNWTLIGGIGASREADTVNFKEGAQGIKLIATNGNDSFIDKVISNNFSNTNNFAFWLYVYDASKFDHVTLYFTSTGSAWSKYFSKGLWGNNTVKTGWNKIVFGKSDFGTFNGESWNNVMNRVRLRIGPAVGQNVNATVDDLRYDMTGQRAKMIIDFDDAYGNVTKTLPILSANNQSAVTFVITSGVGNEGEMNLADLRSLQSKGWDISSHTVNHANLPTVDDSTQTSELNDSYDWLVTNNFQKSAGFIAYPNGAFNDAVIDKVKKRYILGRATVSVSTQQHFNPSDDAESYIQRIIYILNTTTVQSVKDQINDSINSKLLGVLVFHDIVDSDPATYQYLKADFQIISDYIKSRSTDIDVITYSDYVIPNIKSFTPVINKTTRIYSNGSSVLVTKNKYDEYMPNMTVKPSSGSIDIDITTYNETGGLIKFNESSPNSDSNLQVSYEIGDRIPNQVYSIKIYWINGTKYQDFYITANSSGYINYNLTGFRNSRYQVIRLLPFILRKDLLIWYCQIFGC